MQYIFTKIAAVLAFGIGVMAIFAGGQVLLGNDPGYHVIYWVVIYNVTIVLITALFTALLIWRYHRFALLGVCPSNT